MGWEMMGYHLSDCPRCETGAAITCQLIFTRQHIMHEGWIYSSAQPAGMVTILHHSLFIINFKHIQSYKHLIIDTNIYQNTFLHRSGGGGFISSWEAGGCVGSFLKSFYNIIYNY